MSERPSAVTASGNVIGDHLAELAGEFSGKRAQEHVAQLTRHFRAPGSSGYHAALDYVRAALDRTGVPYGLDEFQLDGTSQFSGMRVPLAWEPRSARLDLVEPVREPIVHWDDTTSCLPWWCPPTPEGGIDLELVDVGQALTDDAFARVDAQGKAVLVHDCGENFAWSDIIARAVRHGAAAVVSNYLLYQYEPWRTRRGLPAAVQQLRLPSRHENPWVLTISQPAFERLRGLLEEGRPPVVLRFDIDTETFEGTSRSVLASIPGTTYPEQSVILVAHVTAATKPGANCASGVALLLELSRALHLLIEEGRIQAPKRSVHFLFANEDLGSAALVRSRPDLRAALAAVSVCSVGHDQAQTRSALIFGRSPDSLPTFMNDLVAGVIDRLPRELGWAYRGASTEIPRLNWSMLPYTPWSDNVTWAKLGVPAMLCMSLPDRYFHTQLLTVAQTDPETFRFSGLALGTSAIVSAMAGAGEAGDIMRLVVAHAETHLDRIALEASDRAAARLALDYAAERDIANLRSVARLLDGTSPAERTTAEQLMTALEGRLREKAAALAAELDERPPTGARGEPSGDAPQWSGIVPRQTDKIPPHGVPGFAYPQVMELVESMRAHDPSIVPESLQLFVDEVWNLSRGGKRDLAAITSALAQEFGFELVPEHVHQIALGLARTGYLELPDVPS